MSRPTETRDWGERGTPLLSFLDLLLSKLSKAQVAESSVSGTAPVVEDVEGRELAPQHLHGHHVDDQHPDGAVKDFNLLTNNSNIFRNRKLVNFKNMILV
jgi:hypothetical protein